MLFTPSGALTHTTSWLKSAMEEMMSATSSQSKAGASVPNPIPILNTAFLGILTWDYEKNSLPEVCVAHSINCIIYHKKFQTFFVVFQTLMNDEMRLRELQWQLQQCQMVNEVLLIVHSTIGDPIQGLPSLSERLKRMTFVLLDGMHHS